MPSSPAPVPLLDLQLQYAALREDILPRLAAVLESQAFCNGPACQELEQAVAAYSGVSHAVSCSSGTDALILALLGLEISCGDEVITSPFTFFATAGSLYRQGVRPVFADIDPQTFNLDPSPANLTDKINERTRAIMPVHLFGQMADMPALKQLAQKHNLHLIEDAAQAIGASCHGRKAGQDSAATALSFYPTKNLGGAGDGGMVLTPDPTVAERMRIHRNHGADPTDRYRHHVVGGNFRMDTLNAAYLLVKLMHLETWHAARQRNAAWYDDMLADLPGLTTPHVAPGCTSIYNQYVLRIEGGRRDVLQQYMSAQGVGSAIYYPLCLHQQTCFAPLGHGPGDFPHAERAVAEVLAIPIYPELTEPQVRRVGQVIRAFFGKA